MPSSKVSQHLITLFKTRWDDVFLIDKEKEYTYGQFFSAAVSVKNWLQEKSLGQGKKVCIITSNSSSVLITYIGLLLNQNVVIPIDNQKSAAEINETIELAQADAVIHDQSVEGIEFTHDVTGVETQIDQAASVSVDKLALFENIDTDTLFLMTFTSGTTGVPKGVMHSFANLFKTAQAFAKKFNFNEKNIWYHNLPMAYMAGILNAFIKPLVTGGKLVIGNRFSLKEAMNFWEIPLKNKVNTFWLVPTMLVLLTKFDRDQNILAYTKSNNVIACVGTAPLYVQTKQQFEQKYNIAVYESYGTSEALFNATNAPDNDTEGSVGTFLEGLTPQIADDGELLVKVPWMFLGYSNYPTDEVLVDGYLRTGDLASVDSNGIVTITGRKKDLIIRGGINISPRRIEDELMKSGLFDEIAIIGVKDSMLGEKIFGCYVPQDTFSEEKLSNTDKTIKTVLGKDYAVDEYKVYKSLPKNINGKIDKKILQNDCRP